MLETSARHAQKSGMRLPPEEADTYWSALHLQDLALVTACAAGSESAWEHFVREYRPALYRAADAIDPTGAARELADAIHAELFGLREQGGVRQSLFRYFHGRSSLGTWLRAVLAQRHVDRLRATRRLDPLPEDESAGAALRSSVPANPDVERQSGLVRKVLAKAIEALPSGDRLRLGCYYAQNLTLAEIGRLFGEHEATASRHLSRIRKTIRHDVEQRLRDDERLDAGAIEECFEAVLEDAGTLDLTAMLGPGDERKKSGHARSKE